MHEVIKCKDDPCGCIGLVCYCTVQQARDLTNQRDALLACANKLLELVEEGGCNIPSWHYISLREAVGRPITG